MCKNSAEAREKLVEALELDLIGPSNGHAFERELLPRSPRTWYLTGMLVPVDAKVEAREDPASDDEIDDAAGDTGGDDGGTPDKAPKRRGYLPSSIGMSFLVPPGVDQITVRAEWGEYRYEVDGKAFDEEPTEDDPHAAADGKDAKGAEADAKSVKGYRRAPCSVSLPLAIGAGTGAAKTEETLLPTGDGLSIAKVVRVVDHTKVKTVPAGTRSVSIFLVNRRVPHAMHAYRASIFQPRLVVECAAGFVPRPDPRGELGSGDEDERVADLQYRSTCEYAVGHGVATHAKIDGGCARVVSTEWMPRASVERVEPTTLAGVTFGMETLGALADAAAVRAALGALPTKYAAWIDAQAAVGGLSAAQAETLRDLVQSQRAVCKRLASGIELLASKPDALEAFRIANRAMAAQARRRIRYTDGDGPAWRPFQLAFILMALCGIDDPTHTDRETVDLLFFPTGGGKTEAYLGLAAFTLVLRRLRKPTIESAGVTVLMRYTLRLLTLDQLGRATALICALELEREKAQDRLGKHPFEIGLWVGSAATPNKMGKKGPQGQVPEGTALKRTLDFKSGRGGSPIPLESCPWCGARFTKDSFRLEPDLKEPQDLFVYCANPICDFTGNRRLPVLAVDEPIYRRLPCFLISTVDKFAALPWTAEVGQLLGHVNRHDAANERFSRDPSGGPVRILPPELVIQDELHLISGPLGTVAGIYEGAIDALASREVNGKRVRPKIVASTATVRRAQSQIRALFDRKEVAVFPPPGSDLRDSFFARTTSDSEVPGRLYVGIAAQGRSLKVVYLRALLALLGGGQSMYAKGKPDPSNPVDPYMTVVGYFNSLRELGGSRRIAEDEVSLKLKNRPRRRLEPAETLFEPRNIQQDMLELTSRVSTDEVAAAKERLGRPFSEAQRVDLALATNMISVGLDITRLGLMVMLGQPKTSSEYIQASSRVGRDKAKPGLVVVLLNIHKPRDRSHYERFESFHASFYRSVEATSVTPGAPRALDRALAPALVGLVRQAEDAFNPSGAADKVIAERARLDRYAELIADRARSSAAIGEEQTLHDQVLARSKRLLDWWMGAAQDARNKGLPLSYDSNKGGGDRLLREVLDPDLAALPLERRAFRAGRSMRDVEPPVDLYLNEIED